MKRRIFLQNSLAFLAGAAATPRKAFAKTTSLKMVTTWPARMPILQEAAHYFSKRVKAASGGSLRIRVYAGSELVPPLGVFDAVRNARADMGYGSAYYWSGKVPAAQFFGSVPFGMSAQQFYAWMISGGGQELWNEVYQPYNLVPFSFGNTGVQTGGWFKKPISSVADLKGLTIRMPGLGGKVMARAGANVVLMPGSEIYTALERGTIDATEWISPFHDERLGLQRAAKYCYYPGWQEPGSNLELTVNSKVWDNLSQEHQAIIRSVSAEMVMWVLAHSEAKNGPALERMKTKYKVDFLPFPKDVLQALKQHTTDVIAEICAQDPLAKKVYTSYDSFRKQLAPWAQISEVAMAEARR